MVVVEKFRLVRKIFYFNTILPSSTMIASQVCFIMMRSVLRMEAIDSQAILTPLAMRVQFSITA
jgi:hypothetical protein